MWVIVWPQGVFAPYTGIATNVLFFEKGEPTRDGWFFEHPYPGGYKGYSRSKPLDIREFDLEEAWWGGTARLVECSSERPILAAKGCGS